MAEALTSRVLGAEDQPIWRVLRLEALELYPNAFLTTLAEAKERPADVEADMLGLGNMIGVFNGTDMIASGGCRTWHYVACQHRAEIGPFYVTPNWQGHGAAEMLMSAMVELAQSRGSWQLELFVAEDNARARRFYERQGFHKVGYLPNSALVNDKMTSDIFMVRDLRR